MQGDPTYLLLDHIFLEIIYNLQYSDLYCLILLQMLTLQIN